MNSEAAWVVPARFWVEAKEHGWDGYTKLGLLFLWTCPFRTPEGVFSYTARHLGVEMGWATERAERVWDTLTDAGRIVPILEVGAVGVVGAWSPSLRVDGQQAEEAVGRLERLGVPESHIRSLAAEIGGVFASVVSVRFGERLLTVDDVRSGKKKPGEPSRADILLVFDTWREAAKKTAATKLDSKRENRIVWALKNYPLEDVLDAVRGWENDPFWRGETNRTGRPINELTVLLRDGPSLERFRDLARGPRRSQYENPTARTVGVFEEPGSSDGSLSKARKVSW